MRNILLIIFIFMSFLAYSEDEILNKYLEKVLEKNLNIKESIDQIEQIKYNAKNSTILENPVLSINYFLVSRKPDNFGLMASQGFPWFGLLKDKRNAINLMADAKFNELENLKKEVIYLFKESYFELILIKNLQKNLLESQKNFLELKRIFEKNYSQNKIKMVELIKLDLKLFKLQNEITIIKEREKPIQASLNELLNNPINENILTAEDFEEINFSNDEEAFSLNNHNLIKSIEQKESSTRVNEKVINKDGLPNFMVELEYMKNPPMMMENDEMLLSKVKIGLPLYRDKTKFKHLENQKYLEQLEKQKLIIQNNLLKQIEITKFEIFSAVKNIEFLNLKLKELEKAINITTTSYINSDGNITDLIELYNLDLDLKFEKLENKKMYFSNKAKLEFLINK